jgi:hypothetical protein
VSVEQVKVSDDVAAAFIGLDFAFCQGLCPPFSARARPVHFGFAQPRSDQLDLVPGVAMV